MATAIDPVAEGLADSLVRPGGNVTGLTSLSQELHAKLVEFTHLLLPKAKRLAFVVNPDHVLAKSHHAVAARAEDAIVQELQRLKREGVSLVSVSDASLGRLRAVVEAGRTRKTDTGTESNGMRGASNEVRDLLMPLLQGTTPSLETVATRLGTSAT